MQIPLFLTEIPTTSFRFNLSHRLRNPTIMTGILPNFPKSIQCIRVSLRLLLRPLRNILTQHQPHMALLSSLSSSSSHNLKNPLTPLLDIIWRLKVPRDPKTVNCLLDHSSFTIHTRIFSVRVTAFIMFVLKAPGCTINTLIPNDASSLAKPCDALSSAHSEARTFPSQDWDLRLLRWSS